MPAWFSAWTAAVSFWLETSGIVAVVGQRRTRRTWSTGRSSSTVKVVVEGAVVEGRCFSRSSSLEPGRRTWERLLPGGARRVAVPTATDDCFRHLRKSYRDGSGSTRLAAPSPPRGRSPRARAACLCRPAGLASQGWRHRWTDDGVAAGDDRVAFAGRPGVCLDVGHVFSPQSVRIRPLMQRLLVTGGCGYLGRELVAGRRMGGAGAATWFSAAAAQCGGSGSGRRARPEAVARRDARRRRRRPHGVLQGEGEWGTNDEARSPLRRRAAGGRLVHLSTDLVFAATAAATARTTTGPRSTRTAARKPRRSVRVAAAHPAATIVRTSLIYGGAEPGPQERLARENRAVLRRRASLARSGRRPRGGDPRAARTRRSRAAPSRWRRRRLAVRLRRAAGRRCQRSSSPRRRRPTVRRTSRSTARAPGRCSRRRCAASARFDPPSPTRCSRTSRTAAPGCSGTRDSSLRRRYSSWCSARNAL